MRTTLTLDDDVAAKLQAELRRSRKSLKETVNALLRAALIDRRPPRIRSPFRVETRDLGRLRPGLSLDNIGELLDQVEGPTSG